jgi:tetratricopeptide (TPR) repeat protein
MRTGRSYLSFLTCLALCVLFFNSPLPAQDRKTDSLEKIIAAGKKDTAVISAYTALCDKYLRTGEQQKAFELARRSLELSRDLDFQRGIVMSNYYLAKASLYLARYDDAVKYSSDAILLARKVGPKDIYASALTIAGTAYVRTSNYGKAMDFLLMSLKANEELRDSTGIISSRSNIGILYTKLGDYDKALKEYLICEKIGTKASLLAGLAHTYINISNVLSYMKQIDSANTYLFKALPIVEKRGDKNNLSVIYGNLALNHMDQGKFDEALLYTHKCLAMQKEVGNLEGVANTYLTFTDIYQTMKNSKMVKVYADSGIAMAKELGLPSMERDIKLLLYKSNKETGNYREALENYEAYVKINNEIINEEGRKAIARKEMEFEFQKKESEINAQREKETLLAKEEKRKQQIIIYAVTAILIMVLIVLFIIFRSLRLNKQKNKIISEQKHIVEEKQREILDSIRYAKRIQTSLLPTEKYFDRNIKRD